MSSATSGTLSGVYTSSTKLYFNPSTGTIAATIFNALSDKNQKTNIQIIKNALNIVENLNGVTFEFIDNKLSSAGLIAQEVEEYMPALITEINGTKTLNYNGVIGILVEAIKEQQRQINKLNNK